MENIANVLFIMSGLLFYIEGIPQIVRLIKRKSSDDLSLSFFVLCLVALILFEIGAILIRNIYLFSANFLSLINMVTIIFLIIKYRTKK